jgi:plastocyanin
MATCRWLRVGVGALLLLASAGTAAAQEAQVTIEFYEFKPKELVVPVGTTVTWINLDIAAHTVTGNEGEYDSDLFGRNESWAWTYDAPGTYPYYCKPHGTPGSGMIGTVVVQAPEDMPPPPEDE